MSLAEQYRPKLPPEIVRIIEGGGLSLDEKEVFPYPSRFWGQETKGLIKEVGVLEVIEPGLLAEPELRGSVSVVDSMNGCGLCDTCIRDSLGPSLQFSRSSWNEAWASPKFQQLINKRGIFTFGNTADPGNHEDVAERTAEVLKNVALWGKFKLVLLVNFRGSRVTRIEDLIRLAMRAPTNKMELIVSLPLNKDTKPQEEFRSFIRQPEWLNVFREKENGDFSVRGRYRDFLFVNNLRGGSAEVRATGRIVAEQYRGGTQLTEDDFGLEILRRGYVNILLNPEGLWACIHGWMGLSHTRDVWIPITPKNVEAVGRLPRLSDGFWGRIITEGQGVGEVKYKPRIIG
ncbi:MAG: hypothetical protein V1810_02270 [Candidatus Beckwithbacteria bacterium]